MNNPLRYTDPTGEFVPAVIAFCLTPAGAVACCAVTGAVTDLAIQAGSNWWNGRDVFNEDCYDWSQVAMSGGIGGLTGGAGAWLLRGGRLLPAIEKPPPYVRYSGNGLSQAIHGLIER